jgi:gamma-glutamylcyclotransferase (GGCT)/AIG2-like uncharacterized protein YtfP
MCWIVVNKAGKEPRWDYMDKAQVHNKDGYGLAWYENGFVNTYKTFDYERFKKIIKALTDFTLVIHLRHATKGEKSYDNIHPFYIPSGVMFHNGTMSSMKATTKESDSFLLAEALNKCDYTYIEEISPMVKLHIDDKINRLVFFEDSGKITIMNEELGINEEGNWYSNDYHLKDKGWCRGGYKKPTIDIDEDEEEYLLDLALDKKKHKVFVYGTLKKGYSNHRLLSNAVPLGKATSTVRWAMVGKSMPFPYLLNKDTKGEFVAGEVYLVDDKELAALDRLEGTPHHYRKDYITVQYQDLTIDRVNVYVKTTVSKDILCKPLIKEWSV